MIGIISFPPPSMQHRFAIMANGRVAAIINATFLTSISSLGLYTYISTILDNLKDTLTLAHYWWAWGIGGVIGSFSVGYFIDRTARPKMLMAGIIAIMALAMICIPFALSFPMRSFLPFVLWGAMGWASQAPQQHERLRYQPEHDAAVVALNSSANYLGSAVGSSLGGIVLLAGLAPSSLPFAASCLVLAALLVQCLIMFSKKNSAYQNLRNKLIYEKQFFL
ncbi:hypothetical protein Q8A72_11845 [Aeribacillus pallidus]|uniref:hypothetical protein n=1 Tax=Aeribacillus sp. FSL k6-2211 TaxID=2954608 RepID=UPI002872934F|nr:hypothetical protein [Aeribacillus pallidus]